MKLPTKLDFDAENLLDAIRKDKKRKGDSIDFVLLRKLGNADVEKIPIKELEKVVRDVWDINN